MKLLLLQFFICVIYYSSLASGALPEESRNYHLMWFDSQLGGDWGSTQCVQDLLNCYEMVKGDIICKYHHWYSSVCAVVKEYCDDDHGYRDADGWFEIKESMCRRMMDASRRVGG